MFNAVLNDERSDAREVNSSNAASYINKKLNHKT